MREHKPGKANILASASSGFIELLTFHPLDTLTKRMINHRGKIVLPEHNSKESIKALKKVIFRDFADSSLKRKYISLFPGLSYAILYKVSQRTYQFGGHPFVSDFLLRNYIKEVEDCVGKKRSMLLIHALGGAIIGVGEVLLLPLDLLKVQGQTAKTEKKFTVSKFYQHFQQFGNGGGLGIVKALYRGAGWTAARNCIGCFALFGTSAYIKQNVFMLEHFHHAKLYQDMISSIFSASACVLVAAPFDVVKVRIQAAQLNAAQSGYTILRSLLINEGFSALFKGLMPKLLGAGPKVAFGFTLSQQLAQFFHRQLDVK